MTHQTNRNWLKLKGKDGNTHVIRCDHITSVSMREWGAGDFSIVIEKNNGLEVSMSFKGEHEMSKVWDQIMQAIGDDSI